MTSFPARALGALPRARATPSISEMLSYVSDGDTNGVCYRLGTKFGATAWQNPAMAGLCFVRRSGNVALSVGIETDMVDRTLQASNTTDLAGNWIAVGLLAGQSLIPLKYSARNRNVADRALRNFKLQGSNDAVSHSLADLVLATWTDLDVRVADTTMAATSGAWGTYTVTGPTTPYRWIRLLQNGVNSSGDNYLCVCEIELYGVLNY